MAMKALVIGGSRNIGYYASQRLLKGGATVTYLLRNKACFDSDETIKPYIASGKARIVAGDALKEEDVRTAWEIASEGEGELDSVLFTVGGIPKISLTKGAVLDPPDLCTRAMLNVLSVFPRTASPQPKLILISSNGLTASSHAALPFVMKPLYGWLLREPHADKLGLERVVHYAAGLTWTAAEPKSDLLKDGWKEKLGAEGWLKSVLILRPALLTDGACKADGERKDTTPFRADDKDLKSAYTVSRKDVAFFVVQALQDWEKWEGKCVRIAY